MINAAVQEWIDALRSGDYLQGYQSLHKQDNTFCCLGVALDLWHKRTKKGKWESMKESSVFSDFILPQDVYVGNIHSTQCALNLKLNKKFEEKLIDMNDAGKSFIDIANEIEKYYLND